MESKIGTLRANMYFTLSTVRNAEAVEHLRGTGAIAGSKTSRDSEMGPKRASKDVKMLNKCLNSASISAPFMGQVVRS